MTPEQVTLVQNSWEKVVPISETAAALFYGRLFETDPSLRPMFRGDMAEQGRKLMIMITTVVRGLHNLGALVPAVQELGRRHGGYGVKDEHYATVGGSLIWTLEQGLGPEFTPETKAAWIQAYTILADTMKAAAKEPKQAAA
ncbi:MAG TPA: hemin receptor [Verrucomicrobiales bacterium]|nr:hemin receptor [Verrucomicrobiales bacterium]